MAVVTGGGRTVRVEASDGCGGTVIEGTSYFTQCTTWPNRNTFFDPYPNPTSSELNIEARPLSEVDPSAYPQTAAYELIDAQMEVVSEGNIEGLTTINVSGFMPGRYVLRIHAAQGMETHPILNRVKKFLSAVIGLVTSDIFSAHWGGNTNKIDKKIHFFGVCLGLRFFFC